jgi:CheY-like chemotaxis protein
MSLKLLVAEDEAVNREVVEEMLLLDGLECDLVCNGLEAVEAALSGRYALLLLDYQMPVMDGLEAAMRIRAEEARRRASGGPDGHLPIIAMTGRVLSEDRERGLAAGMDDYLTKPLRIDQLATTVRKWLK